MVFAHFSFPRRSQSDQNSTKNRLKIDLKLRCQKNTQKCTKKWSTWLQHGLKLGPLGSKIVLDTSKSDTEKNIKKQKPVNAWNGKRAFIVDPEGDLRTCVCTCLYEFVYTAMLKIKQNIHKHLSKFNQKSSQNLSKIVPKINPK